MIGYHEPPHAMGCTQRSSLLGHINLTFISQSLGGCRLLPKQTAAHPRSHSICLEWAHSSPCSNKCSGHTQEFPTHMVESSRKDTVYNTTLGPRVPNTSEGQGSINRSYREYPTRLSHCCEHPLLTSVNHSHQPDSKASRQCIPQDRFLEACLTCWEY